MFLNRNSVIDCQECSLHRIASHRHVFHPHLNTIASNLIRSFFNFNFKSFSRNVEVHGWRWTGYRNIRQKIRHWLMAEQCEAWQDVRICTVKCSWFSFFEFQSSLNESNRIIFHEIFSINYFIIYFWIVGGRKLSMEMKYKLVPRLLRSSSNKVSIKTVQFSSVHFISELDEE